VDNILLNRDGARRLAADATAAIGMVSDLNIEIGKMCNGTMAILVFECGSLGPTFASATSNAFAKFASARHREKSPRLNELNSQ
jgi:hypothetical protein